jgi:uncharacterized protein YbjT (DUF2867 family)
VDRPLGGSPSAPRRSRTSRRPRGSRGVVELGSGLTYAEIARALGEILGRAVRVEEIPLEGLCPTIAGIGFNPDLTSAYVDLVTGMRSGALDFKGGHLRVAASTSIESFLRSRMTA